ncbi:MAG: hypothetical protein HY901_36345 [Deltaproteobacteria bacterium]|nr:hypothetical protein [Deltaproteobacteria bacterium]
MTRFSSLAWLSSLALVTACGSTVELLDAGITVELLDAGITVDGSTPALGADGSAVGGTDSGDPLVPPPDAGSSGETDASYLIGTAVVAAQAGDDQVVLSWSAVAGATSYDIARGTAAGTETLLASVDSPGFTDTSPTAEVPNFYTVTAKSAAGSGDPSAEVSATPFSLGIWHRRFSSNLLRAAATGGGTTVAAGDGLRMLTSTDDVVWTDQRVPGGGNIGGLAYGAGLFVAVGSAGLIATSPDGIAWTSRDSGTTAQLTGVAFGGSASPHFVAVGHGSTVLTSADGVSWTTVDTNLHHTDTRAFDYQLRAVAYGAPSTFNFFVITASDDHGNVGYVFYVDGDSNLETWSPSPAASLGVVAAGPLYAITLASYQVGNSRAVPSMQLAGHDGTWVHGEKTSLGTLEFTAVSAGSPSDGFFGLAYDGTGTLTLVGNRILTCSLRTSCKAGANGWTEVPQAHPAAMWGATYSSTGLVAVGSDEAISTLPAGASAVTEAHRAPSSWITHMILRSLAGIGQNVVAVGGTDFLYSSDGGATFTNQTAPTTAYLGQVRVIGNRFFAVGADSTILRSETGAAGSWTAATVTPANLTLYDIASNGSLYLAVGYGGEVLSSTDGDSWTLATTLSAPLWAITWEGTTFLAGGQDGKVRASTDGVTWTDALTDSAVGMSFATIAVHGSTIIASGALGHLWISTDHGQSWTPQVLDGDPAIQGMAHFEGQWVLAGDDVNNVPILYTSNDDGATWRPRGTGPSITYGLGVAAGRVFVTGHQGTIYSTL